MDHPSKRLINAQSKEIIFDIYNYFEKEKVNGGPLIDASKSMDRVAAATGVSERIVYRLCKEAKEAKDTYEHANVCLEPHNHCSATVTLFDDVEKCLLRRTLQTFMQERRSQLLNKFS